MEYKISGTTMPLLQLTLQQGEQIYSQAGAMKYMTDGVTMETSMSGGIGGAFKRAVMGEKLFFAYFSAQRDGEQVAFGHTYPGYIIPVDVSKQSLICQKRAFLCATEHVKLDIAFQRRLGAGFFGGEGFVMQRLSGQGTAFVEIDGECVELDLPAGRSIRVETGAVGMYEESIQMDIEMVKGFKNVLFGGEGLFLTTLRGPGRVWIQTMPIQGMVGELMPYLPKPSNN